MASALIVAVAAPGVAAATYPGGNGRIAYAAPPSYGERSLELFTLLPDGVDPRRLTTDPFNENQPSWSADGTRIVFAVSGDGRGAAIFSANADGTDVRFLTRSRYQAPGPTFSRNGRRVLFTTITKLITVRADGTGGRKIIASVPRRQGSFTDPTFSPDGKWIVFEGVPEPEARQGIWKMRVDGSHLKLLSRGPAQNPDFSPDGRSIVFWPVDGSVWLMRANGKQEHRLPGTVDFGWPAFSPVGDRLVAVRTVGRATAGCGDIYTMAVDGSDLRRVTHYAAGTGPANCPGEYAAVSFSPVAPAWQPLPD